MISSLLYTFILIALTSAADVNVNFDIVNANIAPDGYSRSAVLVNGVFPGTLIQAQKDDTLHIAVNNQLTDPNMRFVMYFYFNLYWFETQFFYHPLGAVHPFIGTAWYDPCPWLLARHDGINVVEQFQSRTGSEDGRMFVLCPVFHSKNDGLSN